MDQPMDAETELGTLVIPGSMLDGSSWQEAFTVKCDAENNPDVDVRSGLLTVDVSIRPVYPAEFIRIRFQQSAMRM